MALVKDYISRHQNLKVDLVLLAGTNDLSSRSVSPEFLISSLENSITELKEVSNLQQIFICKIPPRFDFHNVNSKVTRYNVLLEEHFPDSDFVHVLDTVTPEFRHYHTDGLHLSQLGLRKVCSIILSKLHKVLAPDRSKHRNKSSAKKHSVSKGSNSDSGSSLNIGCWNVQYFKTAQLYFKSIIDQFDILAISEHSVFEEQLGILKTATDGTYNYHAVSASDNPRIISGEKPHGGVALLWKYSISDFVTPIKSIQSDRIVGIKCEFSDCRPLSILGVYLPSCNHTLDEFQECLDLLWALYESLSADGFVIVLGDVNGDLEIV